MAGLYNGVDDEEGYATVPSESSEISSEDMKPLTKGQFTVSYRYRSPRLLIVGAISAYISFATCASIVMLKFYLHKTSMLGTYASGNGHWPATVSEGVSNAQSPQGKIFFAFGLVAGLCIFLSWYPYMLRNAYTGNETVGRTSLYWITVRQFVPPIGLLILICVQTVPASQVHDVDNFSVAFHLVGATMMFVGFLVCEMKCMQLFGWKGVKQHHFLDIEGPERLLRELSGFIIFFSFSAFVVCQAVLVWGESDEQICCHDSYFDYTWIAIAEESLPRYNVTKGEGFSMHTKKLVDTASRWVLFWKVGSFTSECVAGVALVTSHVLIWAYCEERHVDYAPVPLQEVYDEDADVMTEAAMGQLALN